MKLSVCLAAPSAKCLSPLPGKNYPTSQWAEACLSASIPCRSGRSGHLHAFIAWVPPTTEAPKDAIMNPLAAYPLAPACDNLPWAGYHAFLVCWVQETDPRPSATTGLAVAPGSGGGGEAVLCLAACLFWLGAAWLAWLNMLSQATSMRYDMAGALSVYLWLSTL